MAAHPRRRCTVVPIAVRYATPNVGLASVTCRPDGRIPCHHLVRRTLRRGDMATQQSSATNAGGATPAARRGSWALTSSHHAAEMLGDVAEHHRSDVKDGKQRKRGMSKSRAARIATIPAHPAKDARPRARASPAARPARAARVPTGRASALPQWARRVSNLRPLACEPKAPQHRESQNACKGAPTAPEASRQFAPDQAPISADMGPRIVPRPRRLSGTRPKSGVFGRDAWPARARGTRASLTRSTRARCSISPDPMMSH